MHRCHICPIPATPYYCPNHTHTYASAQLYQAHAQRLPSAAAAQAAARGWVAAGRAAAACPSDRLLDLSWHTTTQAVTDPLTAYLVSCSALA
jgi:hypothetical protein